MNEEQLQQARMNQFAGIMFEQVKAYTTGRDMDRSTMEGVQRLVDDLIQVARHRDGLKQFPDMVVIGFQRLGHFEICRRDYDEAALRTWIVNLTVKLPEVTPGEIAAALQAAYPKLAIQRAMKL